MRSEGGERSGSSSQKDNKPLSEAGKQSTCGADWLLLPELWAGPHGAGCRWGSVCLRTSVRLPLCRPEGPGWIYGSRSGLHFPWLSGQVKMSPLTTLLPGNLFTSCGWAFEARNHVLLIHGPSPCTGTSPQDTPHSTHFPRFAEPSHCVRFWAYTWNALFYFILMKSLWGTDSTSEKSSSSPRVTHLVKNRAKIWIGSGWLPRPGSKIPTTLKRKPEKHSMISLCIWRCCKLRTLGDLPGTDPSLISSALAPLRST